MEQITTNHFHFSYDSILKIGLYQIIRLARKSASVKEKEARNLASNPPKFFLQVSKPEC